MLLTMKQFEKMIDEEIERYETSSKEELAMQPVSGFICGAESLFRPWELLFPSRSLYFPWGRKRCEKNLENAIACLFDDFFFHRVDIVGVGPYGKMAIRIIQKYLKEHPDANVRLWLPGPVCAYTLLKDEKRFSRYQCDFVYFYYSDSVLRMETAILLHSDIGMCFDLSPRSKKRLKRLQEKTGRGIFNLADKDFWEDLG